MIQVSYLPISRNQNIMHIFPYNSSNLHWFFVIGRPGLNGPQGIRGRTGMRGLKGAQGRPGLQGFKGFQGIKCVQFNPYIFVCSFDY